jgi:hypothetical protein
MVAASLFAASAAIAQDEFPDVPENHWASKQVSPPNPVMASLLWIRDFLVANWANPMLWLGLILLFAVSLSIAKVRRQPAKD